PLPHPAALPFFIKQCIKKVLKPIGEAKLRKNSYVFRPNGWVKNEKKAPYNRLQISQLHYVIEFDIKGFFDNVNHSKLIKQIWAMGIRDKHLIFILKRILKAPIKMPDGTITYPEKGTPQGGIISPLL
ncbi:group II intron reverse transcriptase/maturase, partial [Clostridioides difficile]|uniref:reverse transcriptase domain-containing protein n=1 Tax=Clostridioides difficile TaxID=1496 RepID=UPI001D920A1C